MVNMNEVRSMRHEGKQLRRKNNVFKSKGTYNAAKELLKNGILVETSKGLVCMSLKDALDNGVGGHSLSVEDFQTVATVLLFQEEPKEGNECEGNSPWNDNPGASKKILKQVKTNFSKKGDINKITLTPSMQSSDSTGKIVKFKDIHDSLLEYTTLDQKETITKVSKKSVSVADDQVFIELDMSALTKIKGKNKLPSSNEKNLEVNNGRQPVISEQKMTKKVFNKNESICVDVGKSAKGSESVLKNSSSAIKRERLHNKNCTLCDVTFDNSEVFTAATEKLEPKPAKRRGGWPKGRKRKAEVKLEIIPPKAPATGYVLFLNKRRKEFTNKPITEVTKILGNEWSRLSLQEKKVYLDQAEVEKKRYKEELRLYRQSDAYQTYLKNKQLERIQENKTEESDIDARDEIDDDDRKELYCRLCNQWFHSWHNKKSHLHGKQHLQSIAEKYSKASDPDLCNANMSSTSLDESSLDGSSCLKSIKEHCCIRDREFLSMDEAMVRFMVINKEREDERKVLLKKLDESKAKNQALVINLQQLNEIANSLTCMRESERTSQILLEQRLFNLFNVPTLFYLEEPLSEENE